jgi:hypothetical protein
VRLEAQHEFFDVDRHVVFAYLAKRVLQVLLNKRIRRRRFMVARTSSAGEAMTVAKLRSLACALGHDAAMHSP